MAESFGVEGRGFVSTTRWGRSRGTSVQNHLPQRRGPPLPWTPRPASGAEAAAPTRRWRVLEGNAPGQTPRSLVRGQYVRLPRRGPASPGLSTTEDLRRPPPRTIESWRWAGVPFLRPSRQGPCDHGRSRRSVEFQGPRPACCSARPITSPTPTCWSSALGAHDGRDGEPSRPSSPARPSSAIPWTSTWTSSGSLGTATEAYERLLGDAIEGNAARFAPGRTPSETAWTIVQPLPGSPGPGLPLPRGGSWGAAGRPTASWQQHRRWHKPGADRSRRRCGCPISTPRRRRCQ